MIRYVLKKTINAPDLGHPIERIETVDGDATHVEACLKSGGWGNGGCSVYELVGVELIDDQTECHRCGDSGLVSPTGLPVDADDCPDCTTPKAAVETLMADLQRIAALADTASAEHRETFDSDGVGERPPGWRVAEKMRELSLDAMSRIPARYYQ